MEQSKRENKGILMKRGEQREEREREREREREGNKERKMWFILQNITASISNLGKI